MPPFNSKSNENRQKTPEVTAGDVRGMHHHLADTDRYTSGLYAQLNSRYPARAAISGAMQPSIKDYDQTVANKPLGHTPVELLPEGLLNIEAIRRSIQEI